MMHQMKCVIRLVANYACIVKKCYDAILPTSMRILMVKKKSQCKNLLCLLIQEIEEGITHFTDHKNAL